MTSFALLLGACGSGNSDALEESQSAVASAEKVIGELESQVAQLESNLELSLELSDDQEAFYQFVVDQGVFPPFDPSNPAHIRHVRTTWYLEDWVIIMERQARINQWGGCEDIRIESEFATTFSLIEEYSSNAGNLVAVAPFFFGDGLLEKLHERCEEE